MATNNNETTMRFNADISGLKKGLADANRQIRLANAQFQAAASGMDSWSDSADGLTAKISQLETVQDAENKKLELLKKQYDLTAAAMGENSTEAQELLIQINNQQTKINRVNSELNNYRDQLEEVVNATDNAGDAAQNNISAYDRLSNEISDQEAELKRLRDEYKNYVIEGNEASDEAQDLAARISDLSDDLNDNRTALNNADDAADNLAGSMDDAGDAIKDADGSTETLSEGFTILKGAIADLVADGIQWCIDSLKDLMTASDEAFNSFQAKTGTSAEAMGEFKDQISDLYKSNYGDSLNDVADVMAQVAQTSKETDPSKIQELTKSAIVLRDTFGFEVEESMRAVNMLMDQFGISGEEAFNLIAQGAQNGLDKNGDLLDSINEYSVHYKQLGFDAEDFFNSLSNGTEAGTFSVDKLGDAMKEFGIRVREGGDDVDTALASMGLVAQGVGEKALDAYNKNVESLEKLNEKIAKGGTDAQMEAWLEEKKILESKILDYKNEVKIRGQLNDEIQAKYGDLYAKIGAGGEEAAEATNDILNALFSIGDPLQQNAYGVALFGTMWEDLGAEGVKALMDVSGEADATAETLSEIDAIKYNDLGNAFEEISRIIKVDLLQPIMDELEPTIKSFVEWLKSEAIPWLIENGDKLIAVISGIAAAFVAFKAVTIIQGVISTFAMLIPVIKSVGVAQAALNVIMAANPVGLIVAAIAGLVTAFVVLWNKSDAFREFWINLWEKIKETTKSVIDAVVKFFTDLWDGITEAAGTAAEFISDIWTGISEFFGGIWKAISGAAGAAWDAIKDFFAPAVEWFSKLLKSIKDTVDSVITVIVGLAKGCWEIIKRVFEIVADWFNKNVIQPVSKFFSDMWDKISEAAKTAWDGIKAVFEVVASWFDKTIITPVSKFFGDMWDKIKSGAAAAWDGITSVFGVVVDWFREKFSAAWQAVKDVFSTGGEIFSGIKDGIVSAFTNVVNSIIRGINKIITIPFNAINDMLNKISDITILDIQPFAGLWKRNPLLVPQIPELAKGGVLKRGQVGLLEGNGAEAVVPLEKNTQWIKRVAAEMSKNFEVAPAANNSTNNTVNNYTFNQTNNSPRALNRLEIYRQSKQQTAFIKAVTSGV